MCAVVGEKWSIRRNRNIQTDPSNKGFRGVDKWVDWAGSGGKGGVGRWVNWRTSSLRRTLSNSVSIICLTLTPWRPSIFNWTSQCKDDRLVTKNDHNLMMTDRAGVTKEYCCWRADYRILERYHWLTYILPVSDWYWIDRGCIGPI